MVQPPPGIPSNSALPSSEESLEERNYLACLFSYRTFAYRETLFAELARLADSGKQFDGLVIDLMQVGYTLPLETFTRFNTYAKRLLKPQGILLFVKADGALSLTRDDPAGGLTFNVYDSPFGIFARYPMLADYVCATIPGIDRRRLREGGSTLANHILYTSVPVLTQKGSEAKALCEIPPPQNWVLQAVNDYASVEAISRSLEKQYQLPADEVLRLLQELEAEKIIFPIFSRLQFLSSCYHNRKRFRLGRYMVAAGLLTASQLQELLEIQQDEGWGRRPRTYLGLLAVKHGYINTRELDVLLNDQYLYGGYHQIANDDEKVPDKAPVETVKDSMIGSLGATDTAGLLQSLATGKKTGLLSVENRDKVLNVAYVDGRPVQARLNKLRGYEAIVEFLTTWREGIFVFRDKHASGELDETCVLNHSLDRLLLDSALYQDQMTQILAFLPNGGNSILERVWNFQALWSELDMEKLRFLDGSAVGPKEQMDILALASLIDGLSTVDEVVKSYDLLSSAMILKAVKLLVDHKLVNVQQVSLFRPLTVFQNLSAALEKELGPEDNKSMLKSSLHYVHGSSIAANRFHIDHLGRVSVDLSQVKSSGIPVSSVLLELRRWMEAYLAHCRRQIDPARVNEIMITVVHGRQGQPD